MIDPAAWAGVVLGIEADVEVEQLRFLYPVDPNVGDPGDLRKVEVGRSDAALDVVIAWIASQSAQRCDEEVRKPFPYRRQVACRISKWDSRA